MIFLVVILVIAAIGGVAAYVLMQYSGFASGSVGETPRLSDWGGSRQGGPLPDRIADAPSGCLVAVLVAVAVWITGWLVVLVLGLRVLTA